MDKTIFGFDVDKRWDYENGFYLTSHATRLAKMLAHFDIYRSIVDLPGQVVECGVFKGASLIRFATFRELLESPHSRKIIGFDAFGRFPRTKGRLDAGFIERFEKESGDGIPAPELEKALRLKSFGNFELVAGDILKTVPKYAREHAELKIALLHVDVDVYQPTKVILETLYERVVKGGVVVFDDYGTVEGETRAVDEFFRGKGAEIKKSPLSHIPAYIKK